MTLDEEKQRIDYEIKAKQEAELEELSINNRVGCFVLMFFVIIIIIGKCTV